MVPLLPHDTLLQAGAAGDKLNRNLFWRRFDMALWRIRYEDRYARPRSIYHEQEERPTAEDALSIVRLEVQEGAAPTPNSGADGLNVIGIDEVPGK
jgi:hypothetical protein